MFNLYDDTCTGCGSCSISCPSNAINMEMNEEGFVYPRINQSICTNCRTCIEKCPIHSEYRKKCKSDYITSSYACWSLDDTKRKEGSSGGIFGEIAEDFIASDGLVVGAAYTSEHMVEHCNVDNLNDLQKLKKSKYIQSNTFDIYKEIRKALPQKKVMYVGTPCQCAGLLSYLGEKHSNLFLCDFVCHGVNSPLVHQRYISEIEQKILDRIVSVDHRDKANGWNKFVFSARSENEYINLGDKYTNPFLRGFLTDMFLRKSCYDCKFKGVSRPTDITLGDCWGYPHDEPLGVSLVLIHSEKGAELINRLSGKIHIESYPLAEAVKHNPSIEKSTISRHSRRDEFFNYFNNNDTDIENIIVKLLGNPIVKRE